MTPFGVLFWTTPKLQTKKSCPEKRGKKSAHHQNTKFQVSHPQHLTVGNFVWPIFCLVKLRNFTSQWIFQSVYKFATKNLKFSSLKQQKITERGISANLNHQGDLLWKKSCTSWYVEYFRISLYLLHPRWLTGFLPSTVSQPAIVKAP